MNKIPDIPKSEPCTAPCGTGSVDTLPPEKQKKPCFPCDDRAKPCPPCVEPCPPCGGGAEGIQEGADKGAGSGGSGGAVKPEKPKIICPPPKYPQIICPPKENEKPCPPCEEEEHVCPAAELDEPCTPCQKAGDKGPRKDQELCFFEPVVIFPKPPCSSCDNLANPCRFLILPKTGEGQVEEGGEVELKKQ